MQFYIWIVINAALLLEKYMQKKKKNLKWFAS